MAVLSPNGTTRRDFAGRRGRDRILILPCSGNILILRSEAGRTMEWAQAHFFVGPVAVLLIPALAGESLGEFGENPGSGRAGGAFGGAGNIRHRVEGREAEVPAGLHRPRATEERSGERNGGRRGYRPCAG